RAWRSSATTRVRRPRTGRYTRPTSRRCDRARSEREPDRPGLRRRATGRARYATYTARTRARASAPHRAERVRRARRESGRRYREPRGRAARARIARYRAVRGLGDAVFLRADALLRRPWDRERAAESGLRGRWPRRSARDRAVH